MNWRIRLGMLFGREYVWIRHSHRLTFIIKRAYFIGGRWFTRSKDEGSMQHQIPAPKKDRYAYWMLTPENQITNFVDFEPGTMVQSHDLWFPLTRKVEAWMVMVSK